MLESSLKANRFMLGYCQMLVGDIPDERFTEQPLPGVNHPAWILGHLAYSADGCTALLGGQKLLSAEWVKKFGPKSQLTAVRSDYPTKEELLATLERTFDKARKLAAEATPERLAAAHSNPAFAQAMPTVADLCSFLLTGHLGVHLGQLSSWRRMIGLPPLF